MGQGVEQAFGAHILVLGQEPAGVGLCPCQFVPMYWAQELLPLLGEKGGMSTVCPHLYAMVLGISSGAPSRGFLRVCMSSLLPFWVLLLVDLYGSGPKVVNTGCVKRTPTKKKR